MLRKDDIEILKAIQGTLGCGRISIAEGRQAARYAVNNLDDLGRKIIPFFDKYKLRAKKQYDFELWKEAFEILKRNERKTVGETDTKKLKEIHNKMSIYKSASKPWKWLPV